VIALPTKATPGPAKAETSGSIDERQQVGRALGDVARNRQRNVLVRHEIAPPPGRMLASLATAQCSATIRSGSADGRRESTS